MKRVEEFFRELFTWGTPQCGFVCAVAGIILAFLLLYIGFWKTLFVVFCCAVGGFLGGVKNKADFFKNIINKIVPPKSQN